MKKLIGSCLLVCLLTNNLFAQTTWRSALYPTTWVPGFKDAQGRFLHNFSYAGYKMGETAIPDSPPGATYNVVTQYSADNTGATDASIGIQSAINAAGTAGGGVVYLPAGTYRLDSTLLINKNNVVLKCAGPGVTFLYNSRRKMTSNAVIKVINEEGGGWFTPIAGTTINITADILSPTHTISLASTTGLAVKDWILISSDPTSAFIAEHGMTGWWSTTIRGQAYYRQIKSIDVLLLKVLPQIIMLQMHI